MDAAKALADLKQISTQVQEVVVFGPEARVVASSSPDESRGKAMALAASRLLQAADEMRSDTDEPLVQLEAALDDGSVAVVRDGERAIAATTQAQPTIGLVFYDLRTCLRDLAEEPDAEPELTAKPRASRAKKQKDGDAAG